MIVKKWRNVKDNFNKYLKKLKESSKSGSAAIALKKYHYYHQLLFLMKVQQNATDSSLDLQRSALSDTPESENNPVPHSSRYVPANRKRIMSMDDFEKEALKALKEPENRHMSFFKSILPSLQEFTDLQTITFQSRVLQMISEMRYGETIQPWHRQTPQPYGSDQGYGHTPQYGYNSAGYTTIGSNSYTSPSQASQASQESGDQEEFDFTNI